MRTYPRSALLGGLLLATSILASGAAAQEVTDAPKVILGGVPFSVSMVGSASGLSAELFEILDAQGFPLVSGTVFPGATSTAVGIVVSGRDALPLQISIGAHSETLMRPFAPGWFSILPPLLAILMALIFREVLTALFAGIWLGALAVAGYNPLTAVWRVIDQYAVPALGDTDGGHTQIIVFTLLLGGMVGVIARNGGTQGIVDAVSPFARNQRRGKIATWLAGLAIFFDDYANTLIVGNTMRPITDRLKISREKLAYIVDSTAAPVAALVPISTWVGYEISLIAGGMRSAANQPGVDPALAEALATTSPFGVFIATIPHLFYPLFALAFVFITSYMNRDFGPMAAAEQRAAQGDGLFREGAQLAADTRSPEMEPKEGATRRWHNAAIPVLTVIMVVLIGLYTDGKTGLGPNASLMDIFGAADPFKTLLWGSFAGCLVAILLSVVQRILTLQESLDAWVAGMKAMLTALLILVLAWSLGQVTEDLGTAQYLAQILSDALPIELIPVLVFITASAIAFATGTSWATMAVLIPVVIPLTVSLGGGAGFETAGHNSILLGAISSVLAGAIFGDHCSPISDTTVLSSTASGCDHVDHVRTQLPYALLVALVAMILGDVATSYGLPNWIALILGVGVLVMAVRTWGQEVTLEDEASGA